MRTVLIVDDVEFVRKTLREIFAQSGGYQVVGEAADGLEAITRYAELRPDVVTMDMVMPEMSGIEATRRLCKMDKNARVVMVSAMGQENLVMEAINAGARDYVLKPFSADMILKTVDRVMGGPSDAAEAKI